MLAENFPFLGNEVKVKRDLYAICRLIIASSKQVPEGYRIQDLDTIDIGQWACLGNKIHSGNFTNTDITSCSVCPVGMLNK